MKNLSYKGLHSKKTRQEVGDWYARRLLKLAGHEVITDDLIQQKRESVLKQRALKKHS